MVNQVISQVTFEIEQIDRLFEAYADLLDQAKKGTPDLTQVTAIAAVLHAFYNGLENIFLSIAKGIDGETPVGVQWHRDLLGRMAEAAANRGPVLTRSLAYRLADYLGFRHFFRHSYTFFLEWEEIEKLVTPLNQVWKQVKEELELFLESLKERNAK